MDPQTPPPPPPPPKSDPPFIDVTPEPVDPGMAARNRRQPQTGIDGLLRRRRHVFYTVLLVLSSLAVLWLWTQPKIYQATSTVLVSRIGSNPAPVSEGEIASEVQMVLAQTGTLGPGQGGASPSVPVSISESLQAANARREAIRARVDVRQAGASQVISISYTDPSASQSTDQANRLTELYLQQRQRLLGEPAHFVAAEIEAAALAKQAEDAAAELQAFDRRAPQAGAFGEAFRVKTQRLSTIEDRAFELRASVRGQEELLRVLRKQAADAGGARVLQAEAELAAMQARLRETEREFHRLEKAETLSGTLAAKRDELARRVTLTRERAEFVNRKLQESRIAGGTLQARLLTPAEVVPVRTLDLLWWQILLLGFGILLAAMAAAWIQDLFDRPVYSDDEFARMTGAPPIRNGGW